jgi:hypothetical protein
MCTTYAIAFLFATTNPLVTIFAVPFFLFKYYVDKYNLTFVYESKQHGKGIIAQKIMPLTVFCIMFSQLLNASILLSQMIKKDPMSQDKFSKLAISMFSIELISILIYKLHHSCLRYSQAHKKTNLVQLLNGNLLHRKKN